MAEWEYSSVTRDLSGKVFIGEREVQGTFEQAMLDLREQGWVAADPGWEFAGIMQDGWEKIVDRNRGKTFEVQLKRKKQEPESSDER